VTRERATTGADPVTTYWCELAWLGGDAAEQGVVLCIEADRIRSVETDVAEAPRGAVVLRGLTLPGLANAHSHAFHRALRGHTQTGSGTFWSWRDRMYAVAGCLDPDLYHRLARATFAEMALAGVCVVGEFHYLHHRPDGGRYVDPNAMGSALLAAAADAGVRITLLDACYLHGGLTADGYQPPEAAQRRFSDGTADDWAERVEALEPSTRVRIGAAAHSIRAVDPHAMGVVRDRAVASASPLHLHLSEQPAENQQCLAAHSMTPAELAADVGLLDADLTAVHATHLSGRDVSLLGSKGVSCCFCPTTERDLADGIGPARALVDAGAGLCLGSDSHAVIDLFEEARAVELDSRLDTLRRGIHSPVELLSAATLNGYSALGWPGGGRLESGAPADFATVAIEGVRLAGTTARSAIASAVFSATAADVAHVVVGGEVVVRDGQHVSIDVAAELASAIAEVLGS
jgi:formiminoglutamate deiminase